MVGNGEPVTFSHVGICVTDLERSLRFYCQGLGFTEAERHEIHNEFADTLEVARDVVLTSQFIRRGDLGVELLYFRSPGHRGTPAAHRNTLGLTHLSFVVSDLEATAAALVAAGGTVLASTRTTDEHVDLLFLTDPDGTRIELMELLAPVAGG